MPNQASSCCIIFVSVFLLFSCAHDEKNQRDSAGPVGEPGDSSDVTRSKLGAEPGYETETESLSSEDEEESVNQTEADRVFDEGDREKFLQQGPQFVFSQVDVEPVTEGEAFIGYRLVEFTSKARETITPTLQKGDVIKAINGDKIRKPEDFVELWSSLEERRRIRIEIVRRGESMELTFQFGSMK